MGLVCCQWLLGKLKITVSGAKLLHMHSASHFSLQQLTPFGSRFNFPDRLNQPKLMQRQKAKMLGSTNQQRQFQRLLTSSHT
jgi:hypothetical protein